MSVLTIWSIMSGCFCLIVVIAAFHYVQGKYIDVEYREGRNIKGNGQVEFDLKVKKANKTIYATNGQVKFYIPLDDSCQIRSLLFKKQGNEYRLTPYHIGPHNFCDYVQNRALTYDNLRSCSDIPSREQCPWNVNTVTLDKCAIPTDKIPKFMSGEYRLDFELLKGDEILGGYQVFFSVINMVH